MKTTALAICLLLPLSALAKSAPLPIDSALKSCLDKESSTLGMSQCYDSATQAWDKEMNAQYNALMAKLDKNQQAQLRDAQRNWLKYRDSWLKAAGSWFTQTQGTISALSGGSQAVALVKNQALMLKSLREAGCLDPDGCK